MEGEQSFRLCHVHWHILKTSSVCNRTSSTDCYAEHTVGSSTADTVIKHYTEPIVAFSTADTVINHYTEPIEASSTADTVRHCYTKNIVDRIYHIKLICFLIDTWKLQKTFCGRFSFISDVHLYLFTYCLVKKETGFPLCL